MSKLIFIPMMLISWGALAQVAPPPNVNRLPLPPVVSLTLEEKAIANEALQKLGRQLLQFPTPDVNTEGRTRSIQHELAFSQEPDVNPASLPIIGMALSRNSQDPKACALLKKIEPSAVCVK